MYLKLAWRNIWRNKRRTVITMVSIFFAVFLSVFMLSMQNGSYENMIQNTVGSFTGYAQIHQKGYWNEQNIDNTFEWSNELQQQVSKVTEVTQMVPRLESYALLSGKQKSKAGLVMGIDPAKEKALSAPQKKLVEGKYFDKKDERAVLVAQGLAQYLKLNVGDSLVLIGQGFQGQSAVDKFLVKGIVKFPAPDINKSLVYVPLTTGQGLYAAENRLTSLALVLNQPKKLEEVMAALRTKVDAKRYEVMSWKQMMPELIQMIEADGMGSYITIGVLYMVVCFGIFGTILMMTTERRYEFGVLIGIGMKRLKLGMVVILEMLILAILGVVLGALVSSPLVAYFHANPLKLTGNAAKTMVEMGIEPIIPFSTDPMIFVSQAGIILGFTLFISLYPLWFTQKIKLIDALR
ncbi:ABC transporter permease [uncultured Microscilla sp.]|uniref:ABC transporter permease n=1 Tax=uncultured Microscilla sp. TaxID=432653 RepID=UPI00260FA116|nr:ABC transporter permease [uncultured Microscilla sp.]